MERLLKNLFDIMLKLSFPGWSIGFPEEIFVGSIQDVLFAQQIQLR